MKNFHRFPDDYFSQQSEIIYTGEALKIELYGSRKTHKFSLCRFQPDPAQYKIELHPFGACFGVGLKKCGQNIQIQSIRFVVQSRIRMG